MDDRNYINEYLDESPKIREELGKDIYHKYNIKLKDKKTDCIFFSKIKFAIPCLLIISLSIFGIIIFNNWFRFSNVDNLILDFEMPVPKKSISFDSGDELESFILNYDSNKKWLYMNKISKKNEMLNIYNTDYRFNYEKENNGSYVDPYISISFSLYSDKLGTDTDLDKLVLYHSISFSINIRNVEEIKELNYYFYKYKNDKVKYNNVILIKNGETQIGEIYYYTKLDITTEWIVAFLNENIIY